MYELILLSEENILCNGQSGQCTKLLYNDGDSFIVCFYLILWMNFLAIQNKCTAANAVNTGKHIGQGGFSGAVFSDQCMNFSLVNVKGNVLYGFCNTEVLAEIFYL